MFKSLIYTTTVLAASQAFADPVPLDVLADLPPEVASRVMDLEAYGNRFENAIQAIIAEAALAAMVEGCTLGDGSLAAYELPGV